jgi:SPP1 gp7 family putative phage head morphogenesis protein
VPIILVRKATVPDDPLSEAAGRMEPTVRQAFLDAVNSVRDQLTLDQIAAALEKGDANRVMDLLGIEDKLNAAFNGAGLAASVTNVREALQQTFAAGAKAAMEAMPSKVSLDMAFNLLNPEAVRFLDNYTFDLIRQISDETRNSIQATIVRAFKEGGSPYEQARQIKTVIGLTGSQEAAITNYRNALQSGTSADLRNALSRALRDGRYDRTLLSALRNQTGLNQAQIDKMVERYRQRYLQYRAQMIARTETIRASGKGQRELWRQAVEQGLMSPDTQRRWNISGDDRTCDVCEGLDGEQAGLNEEFAPGILDPPDPHPTCRCNLSLVAGTMRVTP